jgi:hypothetical protein
MSVQSIFPDPERRRGSRDYAGPVLELFHENEVKPYTVEYNQTISVSKLPFLFHNELNIHTVHITDMSLQYVVRRRVLEIFTEKLCV